MPYTLTFRKFFIKQLQGTDNNTILCKNTEFMEFFMSIAVICTGTELLKGGCCNTNMQHLGAKLAELAMPPVMELSIGDHPAELCFALSCSLKAADTLIISGGLGPTADDITLETVAKFFGLTLNIVPELKEKVEKRWAIRHT
jgi:nicotinamide-nucleotide amidase